MGCNLGRRRNSGSVGRIFRIATNHSNACIHPWVAAPTLVFRYQCMLLSLLVSMVLVLGPMIHTGAHCIVVTPFYPSPYRPYKLYTSCRHRKSSSTFPTLPTESIHDLPILVGPLVRKVAFYKPLSWCHLRQCLPCTTYASVQFHKSLNIRPIRSICMSLVVVLDLVLAISLSVVVVLDTPTSYNCVFLAFPGVLLQHKSWFRIHLHNFLSTYSSRPNDSNQPYSQWWGKNAHYMDESLLALVSALHDRA